MYVDPIGEKISGGLIKAPKITCGKANQMYGMMFYFLLFFLFSVVVDHEHYRLFNCGSFGYFVIEERDGKVISQGWYLLTLFLLSFSQSQVPHIVFDDYYRHNAVFLNLDGVDASLNFSK